MQQMLQVDLLLRPANLTDLVPTWHGAPSQVNHCAKEIHLISPHKNLQDSSQRYLLDQDPATTIDRGYRLITEINHISDPQSVQSKSTNMAVWL